MNRTWSFEDLEFAVLWEELKEAHLPFPLIFTTDIKTVDQYEQAKIEIRERHRRTLDPEFRTALADMHRPDIRIEVFGIDGKNPGDPKGSIRLLATRRADRGYLIEQRPGRTMHHAEGFVVRECAAVDLGPRVAAALGEQPAGSRGDLPLPVANDAAELDYSHSSSLVQDSLLGSPIEQARDFRTASTTRIGVIDIIQERSVYGPRGRTRHRLEWRDLTDDGRYVITEGTPPSALAVDRNRLVSLINSRIAEVVRVIKDERV